MNQAEIRKLPESKGVDLIPDGKDFKLIILVLEGDFGTHTRPKTAIMSEL